MFLIAGSDPVPRFGNTLCEVRVPYYLRVDIRELCRRTERKLLQVYDEEVVVSPKPGRAKKRERSA